MSEALITFAVNFPSTYQEYKYKNLYLLLFIKLDS